MPDALHPSAGNRVALNLAAANVGFVKHAEGGNAYGMVVNEPIGPSHFPKKHIANIEFDDLTLQIGFSMEPDIYQWIGTSWIGGYIPKSGALTTYDLHSNPLGQQRFSNALISETTLPTLDVSSKAPGYLTLKLTTENVKVNIGSGDPIPTAKAEKVWQVCNFRLEIPGLDCTQISKIDSLTIKQSFASSDIGISREPTKEPSTLEFPNLVVTLPVTQMQTWQDWFNDFIFAGNRTNDNEKTGLLHLLAPDLKTELATIQFFGLGIFKLAPDEIEAHTDQIRHLKAQMYCEQMKFEYKGS